MTNIIQFPELTDPDFPSKLKDIRIHFTLSRRRLEDILYIRAGGIVLIEKGNININTIYMKRTYSKLKNYFNELIDIEETASIPLVDRMKNVTYAYKTKWNETFYNPMNNQVKEL